MAGPSSGEQLTNEPTGSEMGTPVGSGAQVELYFGEPGDAEVINGWSATVGPLKADFFTSDELAIQPGTSVLEQMAAVTATQPPEFVSSPTAGVNAEILVPGMTEGRDPFTDATPVTTPAVPKMTFKEQPDKAGFLNRDEVTGGTTAPVFEGVTSTAEAAAAPIVEAAAQPADASAVNSEAGAPQPAPEAAPVAVTPEAQPVVEAKERIARTPEITRVAVLDELAQLYKQAKAEHDMLKNKKTAIDLRRYEGTKERMQAAQLMFEKVRSGNVDEATARVIVDTYLPARAAAVRGERNRLAQMEQGAPSARIKFQEETEAKIVSQDPAIRMVLINEAMQQYDADHQSTLDLQKDYENFEDWATKDPAARAKELSSLAADLNYELNLDTGEMTRVGGPVGAEEQKLSGAVGEVGSQAVEGAPAVENPVAVGVVEAEAPTESVIGSKELTEMVESNLEKMTLEELRKELTEVSAIITNIAEVMQELVSGDGQEDNADQVVVLANLMLIAVRYQTEIQTRITQKERGQQRDSQENPFGIPENLLDVFARNPELMKRVQENKPTTFLGFLMLMFSAFSGKERTAAQGN